MTKTEIVCKSCEEQIDQDVDYCPECGEKCPQYEQAKYDWERDVDLPIVFNYELYRDNHEMWHLFCESAFGTRLSKDDISNIPNNFPRLKYCSAILYFKLTEQYELKGPFLDRQEARKA